MNEAEFGSFLEEQVRAYAAEQVESGYWDAADAEGIARAGLHNLLPQGLATEGHRLYTLRERPGGARVGYLWLSEDRRPGRAMLFIMEIQIDPAFRRRGYGRAALVAVDALAREQGIPRVGLHVAASNPGARALYEAHGFRVAGVQMVKTSDEPRVADDGP